MEMEGYPARLGIEGENGQVFDDRLADVILCSYGIALWQKVFAAEPEPGLLTELASERCAQLLGAVVDGESWSGPEAFRSLGNQVAADPDGFLDAMRSEYTRLFLGPNALPVPPWESMHVGAEKLIFGATTLDVRRWYAADGITCAGYPHVADDHLAIELDYLRAMTERAAQAGGQERERLIGRVVAFLDEHILVWMPRFVSGLRLAVPDSPYASLSQACLEYLGCCREILRAGTGPSVDKG